MDWKNKLSNIINKVKFQLHAKKIDDLESFYALINECDVDHSGYLTKDEFLKFLTKIGIFLTTQELRVVFDTFDINKDGKIGYAEFVQSIRSKMSERRLHLIKHVFSFLSSNSALIPVSLLKSAFKAQAHPRVRSRQKTADQVRDEFERSIVKKSSDGANITEAEFLEYYADVNATLPEEKEEFFSDVIISTWGVTASESYVSPERLAQLETILYEKIRQKTFTKEDEGKTLKKAFQYFDLEGKNVVDFKQFSAALRKFGCVFSDVEIAALFQKFDADRSGKIAYDEFCGLFALKGAGTNPNINPVFTLSRLPPTEVLNTIQNYLKKQGVYSLRALHRIFRKADKNKSKSLNRGEFAWALKEVGLKLTKNELDNIFRFFDKNCDDEVGYSEFVGFLGRELNEKRNELISNAWQKLSSGGENIGLAELESFDPSYQVEVKNGKRKKEDAAKEFLELWDFDKKKTNICFDEFKEVYRDLGGNIENDDHFEEMIRKSWNF